MGRRRCRRRWWTMLQRCGWEARRTSTRWLTWATSPKLSRPCLRRLSLRHSRSRYLTQPVPAQMAHPTPHTPHTTLRSPHTTPHTTSHTLRLDHAAPIWPSGAHTPPHNHNKHTQPTAQPCCPNLPSRASRPSSPTFNPFCPFYKAIMAVWCRNFALPGTWCCGV